MFSNFVVYDSETFVDGLESHSLPEFQPYELNYLPLKWD